MASPHVAGLTAYLLSIYPSATFNPTVDSALTDLNDGYTYASIYAFAYTALPRWIAEYLPPPQFFAPLPSDDVNILSPKALKQALIDLSSKGIIIDVGKDSRNRLVFNNATSY